MVFDPSTGQSSPMPQDLMHLFSQVFRALDTPYVQINSFTFDRTWCWISPTRGHGHGPPHGGGHVPGGLVPGGGGEL